jgi:hypothetical protein
VRGYIEVEWDCPDDEEIAHVSQSLLVCTACNKTPEQLLTLVERDDKGPDDFSFPVVAVMR